MELFNRAHNEGPLLPLLARANIEFEAAIARKPDFADAFFQHADYYAHFLIDEAPGHGPALVSATGVGIAGCRGVIGLPSMASRPVAG